jgi:hypothetical protein
MMGFFSEKGKRFRASFESTPVFFDDDLWYVESDRGLFDQ